MYIEIFIYVSLTNFNLYSIKGLFNVTEETNLEIMESYLEHEEVRLYNKRNRNISSS